MSTRRIEKQAKASFDDTALDYWIAALGDRYSENKFVVLLLLVSDCCLASILSQLRNSGFIEELCR